MKCIDLQIPCGQRFITTISKDEDNDFSGSDAVEEIIISDSGTNSVASPPNFSPESSFSSSSSDVSIATF